MHTPYPCKQIIVATNRTEVRRFCEYALEATYTLLFVSSYAELPRHPMPPALLIIDCVSFPGNEILKTILPGNIIFLTNQYHRQLLPSDKQMKAAFVSFPCDVPLFQKIISQNFIIYPIGGVPLDCRLKEKDVSEFSAFAGTSHIMHEVKQNLAVAAQEDLTVLLLGETGTGKSYAASLIHQHSRRKKKSFEEIDMLALPAEHPESELFGTERGAFTDAVQRDGRFMKADGGTVFLDEIGDISLPVQAKLLKVLETKCFYPVGAKHACSVDVRLICATNKNLDIAVQDGTFRKDLFYRIDVLRIVLPPLREHREDIPLLAETFLQGTEKCISPYAIEKLMRYQWPGNIRQLKHCIERAVVYSTMPEIQAEDIAPEHYV